MMKEKISRILILKDASQMQREKRKSFWRWKSQQICHLLDVKEQKVAWSHIFVILVGSTGGQCNTVDELGLGHWRFVYKTRATLICNSDFLGHVASGNTICHDHVAWELYESCINTLLLIFQNIIHCSACDCVTVNTKINRKKKLLMNGYKTVPTHPPFPHPISLWLCHNMNCLLLAVRC